MLTGELDYTECSKDEEHYNRVDCCPAAPNKYHIIPVY